MKKQQIKLEENTTYGNYTVLHNVEVISKNGLIRKEWLCNDNRDNSQFTIKPYALMKKIEKDNLLIQKLNYEINNNIHQLGTRKRLYQEYKENARKRSIEFNISFETFNNTIIENCYYCGSEPTEVSNRFKTRQDKKQITLKQNGIDRLNNNLGYVINNIVTCCSKCNLMKNIYSVDDFLNHVYKITKYNESSTTIPQGSTP